MKLSEIAAVINARVEGDGSLEIKDLTDLASAGQSDLSFILTKKYEKDALASKACAIIADFEINLPGKTILMVENAKASYAKVLTHLYPEKKLSAGISEKASIAKSAKLGANVHVGDFAVIGENTIIGDNCAVMAGVKIADDCVIGTDTVIEPNCVIYRRTEMGKGCLIHANAVIGGDGFAFVEHKGMIVKVPQLGYVKLGNGVEVGNNTTIDRGAFRPTEIGNGVKIDNLVQIAHNVKIDDGTLIAAQTGISGSSTVGKYCIVGGQVGVADHVNIADRTMIGSQSGISKDTETGSVLSGTPARPLLEERKNQARVGKLAEMFDRIKELESEVKKLKEGK